MAFQRLGSGQITTTTRTVAYTVPSNASASVSRFVLTNTGATDIAVNIYVTIGGADQLIKATNIPAGAGKTRNVLEALDSYNAGDIIKIQGGGGVFNFLITGRQA